MSSGEGTAIAVAILFGCLVVYLGLYTVSRELGRIADAQECLEEDEEVSGICGECGTDLVAGEDQFADSWICPKCNEERSYRGSR